MMCVQVTVKLQAMQKDKYKLQGFPDPENTHLTLQSAQGTEQGGAQLVMQRGLLVVDVMVRLP